MRSHGLPLGAGRAADGKVFHAGIQTADDNRVLTSGGRVLCATALGATLLPRRKKRACRPDERYQLGTALWPQHRLWRALSNVSKTANG